MTVEHARVGAIVIDCKDPERLVDFWREITGIEVAQSYPGFIFCTELPGNHIRLAFQKVPEGKAGKNRVHIDLGHDDPKALVARVEELGGSRLDDHTIGDFHWTVLADPEGNEFCVAPLQH